jgi:hypothetical protein
MSGNLKNSKRKNALKRTLEQKQNDLSWQVLNSAKIPPFMKGLPILNMVTKDFYFEEKTAQISNNVFSNHKGYD